MTARTAIIGARILDPATGLDTPGCDAEDLAENLGLMGINEVRVFKDIGMESFAMLTAMRYAASAIFQLAGLPILMAVAIVSGFSTICPKTIGADPAAWPELRRRRSP